MRVGVLGAGMYVTGRSGSGVGTVLASLAECSRSLPSMEVVVMARDPANAAQVAAARDRINRRLGTSLSVTYLTVGEDLGESLSRTCQAQKLDAGIVSVPDHLHLVGAEAFLRSGAHCLVVKPMAPTLEEGRRMLELQQERRLLGMVELHKRYDESNLYTKRLLAEEAIGRVRYFTVEYSQRITIPSETFRAWSAATNIFQYLGVHYVDLIHFMTGARPIRAMAVGTNGVLRDRGIDTHDSVHALVVWQERDGSDQFLAQFAVNWIDPTSSTAMSDQQYTIVGSKGRLELDQKNRGIQLVQEGRGPQAVNPYFSDFLPAPEGHEVFQGYGHRSIATFLGDVLDVRAGRLAWDQLELLRPTFRQALVSTAVIDGVNQSLAAGGRWVELADPFEGPALGTAGDGLQPAELTPLVA